MNAQYLVGLTAAVFMLGLAAAHEDVVDGPHGMERVEDPVRGQGRNGSQDRAYAIWAQGDANTTEVLERPCGKRFLTVSEAVLFAKRTWDVNILDETCDPEVGCLRFALGFGAVEREMALPLFLEALALAVGSRQDCYLERDEAAGEGGTRRFHKGTVHLRRARPLQPDYDHPANPDKLAIERLEREAQCNILHLWHRDETTIERLYREKKSAPTPAGRVLIDPPPFVREARPDAAPAGNIAPKLARALEKAPEMEDRPDD